VLREGRDLAFLAYGTMARTALEAADRLAAHGIEAAVWNARFVRPLDGAAIERLARRVPLLVTLEEHAVQGGFGEVVLRHLSTLPQPAGCVVRVLGVPDRLVPHGERADWLARLGLSAEAVAEYALHECEALHRAHGGPGARA
jgi:1-deoxy-D-xylulose-5-phosphate synthase